MFDLERWALDFLRFWNSAPAKTIMQDSNICRSWFFFGSCSCCSLAFAQYQKTYIDLKRKTFPVGTCCQTSPQKNPHLSHLTFTTFTLPGGILVQVKESMKVFMPCSYVALRVVRCFECYDQISNLWIKSLVLQPQQCWEIGRQWLEPLERWLLDGGTTTRSSHNGVFQWHCYWL